MSTSPTDIQPTPFSYGLTIPQVHSEVPVCGDAPAGRTEPPGPPSRRATRLSSRGQTIQYEPATEPSWVSSIKLSVGMPPKDGSTISVAASLPIVPRGSVVNAIPQVTKQVFSYLVRDPEHNQDDDKIPDSDFLPFLSSVLAFFDSRKLHRRHSIDLLILFFAVNGTLHSCPSAIKIRGIRSNKVDTHYYKLSSLLQFLGETIELDYPLRYYLLPFAKRAVHMLSGHTITTGFWARSMVSGVRYPSSYALISFDFADGLFQLDDKQLEYVQSLKGVQLRARELKHFLEY